jgi:hypothetical protein
MMYTSDRINALLAFYGLEQHTFICGRGSHSSLDHLDTMAGIDTHGGRHRRHQYRIPRHTVGQRVRMHEAHRYWRENARFFHLGDRKEYA